MSTNATAGGVRVTPEPRKVWPYRGYRRHSAVAAAPGALVVVDHAGRSHELPLAGAPGHGDDGITRLVHTVTSHVGARGSVWREPRLLGVDRTGHARLSMRDDGYAPDDLRRVAAAAHIRFDEHRYVDTAARDAAHPTDRDTVVLDVASRAAKTVMLATLVLVGFLVLAGLVALVEAL